MRIFLLAASAALVAVAACSSSSAGGSGKTPAQRGGPVVAPGVETSCAAPFLATESWPQHSAAPQGGSFGPVAPGQRLVVHGYFYTADPCQDTGPGTHQPQRPMPQVELQLTTSDHHSSTVAVTHPSGNRFAFAAPFRVPADAPPGPAVLSDGEQSTITLTIAAR